MDGIAGGCGATGISEPAGAGGGGAEGAEAAEAVEADAGVDPSSAKGGPCESEGLLCRSATGQRLSLRLLPAKTFGCHGWRERIGPLMQMSAPAARTLRPLLSLS